MFDFDNYSNERRFRAAWDAVKIVRGVSYSLFTFGETDLPYFLVLTGLNDERAIRVTQGEVKITRPLILTPDSLQPEFENFFENAEDNNLAQFVLARTASFSNLRLRNQSSSQRIVSDSLEQTVATLQKKLDQEDEDRVAILTAPAPLAGFAVLRYASERILQSMPENIQELREKGFLS